MEKSKVIVNAGATGIKCSSIAFIKFEEDADENGIIICVLCDETFGNSRKFRAHFSSTHVKNLVDLKVSCAVLNERTRSTQIQSHSKIFDISPPQKKRQVRGKNVTPSKSPPSFSENPKARRTSVRIKKEPLESEPSVLTQPKIRTKQSATASSATVDTSNVGVALSRPRRERKRKVNLYPGEYDSADDEDKKQEQVSKKRKASDLTGESEKTEAQPPPPAASATTRSSRKRQNPGIDPPDNPASPEREEGTTSGDQQDPSTPIHRRRLGVQRKAAYSPKYNTPGDGEAGEPEEEDAGVKDAVSMKEEVGDVIDDSDADADWIPQEGPPSPGEIVTPTKIPRKSISKVKTKRRGLPSGTVFECAQCDWKSTHHFNYHRHILIKHNGKEDTTCSYCYKHLTVNSGTTGFGFKRFSCDLCPELGSMNKLAYKLHLFRKHSGEEPRSYMCDKCGYKCYKTYNYRRHKCKNGGQERGKGTTTHKFACKQEGCGFTFSNHHNYHRHLVLCHMTDGTAVTCDVCHTELDGDVLTEKGVTKKVCQFENCTNKEPMGHYEFKRHIYEAHGGPEPTEYTCILCGFISDKLAQYKSHMAMHSRSDTPGKDKTSHKIPSKIYICELCGYQATRKYLISRHIKMEHTEKIYDIKCDLCDFVTFDEYNLKRHILATHEKCAMNCPDCAVRVANIEVLKEHLVSSHAYQNDFTFMCDICGKVMPDAPSLLQHKDMHSRCHVYICHVCDFAAVNKTVMRDHLATHDGEEPVKEGEEIADTETNGTQDKTSAHCCDECDFETNVPSALRRHKRMHVLLNNTSFFHCGESFLTLESFNKHLTQVHKVTSSFRHQCQCCGLILEDNKSLRKHRTKEHKPVEQYMCNECDFTCVRRWNLLRHKAVTHVPILNCTLCDYKHKNKASMIKHYSHHHMVSVPEELTLLPDNKHKRKPGVKTPYVKRNVQQRVVCNICGKALNKMALKKHLEVHQGVKSFKCHHEDCEFNTRTSYSLRLHMQRRHLGVKFQSNKKLFSCLLCQYQTRERSRFVVHLGTKHQLTIEKHDSLEVVQAHEEGEVVEEQIPDQEQTIHAVPISDSSEKVETIYQFLDTTSGETKQISSTESVGSFLSGGTIVVMADDNVENFQGEQTVVMLPGVTEGATQGEQTVLMLADGAGSGVETEQIVVSVPDGEHPDNTVYQIVEYQDQNG